jgi:hypothetical protein
VALVFDTPTATATAATGGGFAAFNAAEEASVGADRKAFAAAVEGAVAASTNRAYARVWAAFGAYCVERRWVVQRADDLAQAVAAFLGNRMRAGYAPALG